jgi:hypothetical protein
MARTAYSRAARGYGCSSSAMTPHSKKPAERARIPKNGYRFSDEIVRKQIALRSSPPPPSAARCRHILRSA